MWSSLLFLLPPSCMVAPIGKSANKLPFSFSSFSNSTTDSNNKNLLPAMPSESSIGMDNQSGCVLTNNFEVRGCNPSPSIHLSREPSMVSSGRSTPYHDRMDMDLDVVATTHHSRTNDLTTSKALQWGYQVKSGDYKRTRQGALAALLLCLYNLQVVRDTTMCLPHVHPPCFYLMSITHSPCIYLKATMLPACALTSYL